MCDWAWENQPYLQNLSYDGYITASVSCQFLDIGSLNQLSNEQKRSISNQKRSVSEQTRSFARNVP